MEEPTTKPMEQAALHNEMSTGLNSLSFDRALSEPLDCYEITGSHLHITKG